MPHNRLHRRISSMILLVSTMALTGLTGCHSDSDDQDCAPSRDRVADRSYDRASDRGYDRGNDRVVIIHRDEDRYPR